MSDFDKAIEVVLKHEGGWADNPNDPGGLTAFGISKAFLQKNFLMGDLQALAEHTFTVERAKEIYKQFFWDPQNYEKFEDQTVATKAFDAAVNMGPQQANRLLQLALGALEGGGIVPDGFVGTQTILAVNKKSPDRLLGAMCDQYSQFYINLAAKKPQLKEFLPGWLKRASWRG